MARHIEIEKENPKRIAWGFLLPDRNTGTAQEGGNYRAFVPAPFLCMCVSCAVHHLNHRHQREILLDRFRDLGYA